MRVVVKDGLEHVPAGVALLLTVTAPSEHGAHCRRHKKCDEAGLDCEVCPCSPPDGVDLAVWNRSLTQRTNRLLEAIRRGEASPLFAGRRRKIGLEYFQAREPQDRGALHIHAVLLPLDGKPVQLDKRQLRTLAMRHGFGHEITTERIGTSRHGGSKARSPGRVSGYLSKYVSKGADLRDGVPWPPLPRGRQAPYRTWTRSRGWPRSMKEVQHAQRQWPRTAAEGRRS